MDSSIVRFSTYLVRLQKWEREERIIEVSRAWAWGESWNEAFPGDWVIPICPGIKVYNIYTDLITLYIPVAWQLWEFWHVKLWCSSSVPTKTMRTNYWRTPPNIEKENNKLYAYRERKQYRQTYEQYYIIFKKQRTLSKKSLSLIALIYWWFVETLSS